MARLLSKSVLLSLYAFSVLWANRSLALESIDVLPVGIQTSGVKQGLINNLDQKYTESGKLVLLSDMNSLELNLSNLSALEPEVKDLVSALNSFGLNHLGNNIHLGTLKVDTKPEISYFAPFWGIGVNEKWTLGFGLPVVTYRNAISLNQYGSNVSELRSQLSGVADSLDSAFARLEQDVGIVAHGRILELGYKPLNNRQDTFLGDMQIQSIYQVHKGSRWGAALRSTLQLPTGPKDDPDDLADPNVFGIMALEQAGIMLYNIDSRLTVGSSLTYKVALADTLVARVPKSSTDSIPGPETKELVQRDMGDQASAMGFASYNFNSELQVAAGYQYTQKFADSYSGSRGGSYSLLSANTASESHQTKYAVNYNTVQAYMNQRAMIPAILSFSVADVIAGKNVGRQTSAELSATLFF